ncbi:MAG: hypothetical protein MZV70_42065 [Desulfobacterales bacterium]|nr:hypothetical protein [Desulfobacterales bacterium]
MRFVGVSNHGTNHEKDSVETMEKVLLAASANGRFDVMLLAYNFIQEEKQAKKYSRPAVKKTSEPL